METSVLHNYSGKELWRKKQTLLVNSNFFLFPRSFQKFSLVESHQSSDFVIKGKWAELLLY